MKNYEEIKKAIEKAIVNATTEPQWDENVSKLLGLNDPENGSWIYYKDENGTVYGYVDDMSCYPMVYTVEEFLETIKPLKLKIAEAVDRAVKGCYSNTFQENEEVTKLLGFDPEVELWFIRKTAEGNYECTISDGVNFTPPVSVENFLKDFAN